MLLLKKIALFFFLILLSNYSDGQKINGVNFVSPDSQNNFSNFKSFQRINANWVAFNPYAFSKKNEAFVKFNYPHSWWGEKTEGITLMLKKAKSEHLKVMLKPHVWVMGDGWCGKYDLPTEKQWKAWEKDYARYILTYALIAEKQGVEMLCIGTEYKIAVVQRAHYWRKLIQAIRKVYKGTLTYAANWDNYQNVTFWDMLDYIGIDAYFPLSKSKEANPKELNTAWQKINKELASFSALQKKKIVFTEFGYKSIHYSAWNQWEIESVKKDENVNLKAQQNTYTALFQNVWEANWLAGGFLWKWYPNDLKAGGLKNSDYTPQHKPVEKLIKTYYQP